MQSTTDTKVVCLPGTVALLISKAGQNKIKMCVVYEFISARSQVAEYTIGFCLGTAENLEHSECLEMAGFQHVHSFQLFVLKTCVY